MTRCVKYIARHEYKLEIDFCDKEESSYKVAAAKKIRMLVGTLA